MLAGPFGFKGGRDHFYRNQGDGTFRDATDEVGMTDTAESYGLGVLASDLDNDGDVDVFVANDSNPNFLYRNDGDGTFTEVGAWSGAGLNGNGSAQAGMGVDAADLDGDGLQEIFVTTFAQDSATLFRNEGGLLFNDVSAAQGLKAVTHEALKWGCAFLDFDHDADVGPRHRQRPHLPAGRLGPGAERVVPPAADRPAQRRGPAGRRLARGPGPGCNGRSRPAASPWATTTTTATSTSSSRRWTRPRSSCATTRRGRATG